MDEKILEKMLNNLLEEAAPEIIDELTKEDLASLENASEEIHFSKEHEEKMKKIFAEARRRENRPKRVNAVKKIAIVAAAVILISGATISSVGAWRESFVKYFLNIEEEYSEVNNHVAYTESLIDNVYFGYVPAGYKFGDINSSGRTTSIRFNSNDKYFTLNIKHSSWNNKFNTESGDISDAVISEKDMVYSENEGIRILSWDENGCMLTLMSNDTKNIIYKIAEKISIVENK